MFCMNCCANLCSIRMTQVPIDLMLYHDVKEILTKANHEGLASNKKSSDRSVTGSLLYFGYPLLPKNTCDEVYPGIWLGEASVAMAPKTLKLMGITHVCNVSMGKLFSQTNTSSGFYKTYDIEFHGIPAMDVMTFSILPYLNNAADFIEQALVKNGKVYVHCQQGISRSATVVIAFLMLKKNMDLLAAMKLVRMSREIYPNDGFLRQLCQLSKEIGYCKRK
uniref:Dual specificity protein phosphatase n=1 Tax=Arion vulgaris TaxID=1028688 RepID=A0A0B7B3L5_9EUPU